ncbi:MAG: inositol monophosphatase family protein [Nakamurella sp.]
MMDAELHSLAIAIARETGGYLAAHAGDHLSVSTKSSPTDTVTNVDRSAEALIVRRITESRPDDGILGEEGTSRPSMTGVRWIVDPLDGTVNYVYGIAAYSVSIGVEVDGELAAGAVYDAARGHLYEAVRGGGARRDGELLRCSAVTDLALSLVGTGFGYAKDVRARQGAIVARLLPQVRDIRRIGSAALDLCAVASGQLDGYYERGINPWDRAAGLVIAGEAGARLHVVADPATGRELTIASAPGVFDALFEAVSQ